MNGAINVEGEEHFQLIFKSVLITVDRVRPDLPPAAERILQLHKGYNRGMEAARRVRFPKSRAVNDYFHMLQHLGGITGKNRGNSKSKTSTLRGKMNPANMTLQSGTYASQNQSRIVAALDSQRHLPSIHLYSRLLQGSLVKWEHVLNEPLAAQYLGADGPGQHSYTMRLEAQTLSAPPHNIHSFGENQEELLFSLHWSGMGGILLGTDCGDQVSEAMHSSWQQAKVSTSRDLQRKAGLYVLDNMQHLYDDCFAITSSGKKLDP